MLAKSVAGELIRSEVEIRSQDVGDFATALADQRENRYRLFRLAASQNVLLGATGTHPWSPWQEQEIIDTPHYQQLRQNLGYVAYRNNTFSVHVHVGVRGADRAVAVSDRMREILPLLLAVSANSPFLDGRDSGLQSARTQIFTKSFPRCGIPDPFGSWQAYADYVEFLKATSCINEFTQIWWSVRPHHAYGTVEVRICDAQSTADESTALAALALSCVAQAALDYDEGRRFEPVAARFIEENFWRAIRYGQEGRMIDFEAGAEFPSASIGDRLLAWTAPARAAFLGGLEPALPEQNGAQRQRAALASGMSMQEVYAAEVLATQRSYASEGVTT
jgi:carboxylate-amine ligase